MNRNSSEFGHRAVIFVVDGVLAILLLAAGAVSAARLPLAGRTVEAITCDVLLVVYCIIEPLSGASPAKWLTGRRVVRVRDGASVWLRCAIKHGSLVLLCIAAWEPIALRRRGMLDHSQWTMLTTAAGVLGMIAIVLSASALRRGRRTLHDRAAGTDVVTSEDARRDTARRIRGFAPLRDTDWVA